MAKVAITEQYLTDIADAIRTKTGLSETYYPSEMAPAILTISGGGGIVPTGTITITENNTYNVTQYASAVVNVPTGSTINNQNKTVTPSESTQSITADNGYTGLGTVTVQAIDSEYVGSDVPRPSSSDFIYMGPSFSVPSGYYENSQTGTVAISTLPTSASSSAASGYNSKATISRSTSNQYINISAGYVTVDSYYTISAVPNGTAGTPTATKGTVTNHAISVTPSVTNTTGYITGSTISGTAVTVSASELVSGTLSITSNGTKDVANYASVNVNVSGGGGTINNQDKSVTPTESQQEITYDTGYTGLGTVTVGAISSTYVGSGISQRSSSNLTVSGATVTAPAGYYAEAASKSVAVMTLPTSVSSSATSGYASKATISHSTSDQYINIPTGYNSAGAYYKINAVANGSVTAPSSISGTTATVSTGTNTLTLTKTVSVTPNVTTAGYISSGTAGNSSVSLTASVTVNPTPTANGATVTIPAGYYSTQTTKSVSSGSATGPTSLSGSSATITTGTNTITLTKTNVTTTPTVSVGYVSSATASTATVALTASVTTKAAATITPGTTNQTIAAGTYLTGVQTIAGDANLVASNIVSGVPIFGVTGSVVLQTYYTGSSAPSSSLGVNGDIYIQQ